MRSLSGFSVSSLWSGTSGGNAKSGGFNDFFVSNKRKEKPIKVNKKSLHTSLDQIDKLRPIREKITRKIRNIEGFAGLMLRACPHKIQVLAAGPKAKKVIERVLGTRYSDLIEVIDLDAIREAAKIASRGRPNKGRVNMSSRKESNG